MSQHWWLNDSKGTILVAPLIPHSWSVAFLGVSENAPPTAPRMQLQSGKRWWTINFLFIFSKCPTINIQSSSFFQIVLPDSHRFSSFSIVFIFSKNHIFSNKLWHQPPSCIAQDLALLKDPAFKEHVETYAKDQEPPPVDRSLVENLEDLGGRGTRDLRWF